MKYGGGLWLAAVYGATEVPLTLVVGAENQIIEASRLALKNYGDPNVTPYRYALEYASSFSGNPVSLMTMARRTSRITASCAVGLSYIIPAAAALAAETFEYPTSIGFRNANSGGSLGTQVIQAYSDPSQVSYHMLSSMSKAQFQNREDFAKLALPVAQRTFVGGDTFQQSYRKAIETLALLHAKEFGTLDSLEYLLTIDNALHFQTDPRVTARAAFNLLQYNHDAHDVYGTALVNLARTVRDPDVITELLAEARYHFLKSDKGVVNALKLDLMLGSPIVPQTLVSIAAALNRGLPSTSYVVAHLTADTNCHDSWNLLTKTVRDYLWSQAARLTLDAGKNQIDDKRLLLMSLAGSEEAEWAAYLRFPEEPGAENLLSFSAHRGRAAAQLTFAGLGLTKPPDPSPPQDPSPPPPVFQPQQEDSEEYVLQQWDTSAYPAMQREEIYEYQLAMLTDFPARWIGSESFTGLGTAPIVEAVLLRSWNAFFGLGRQQSLRDCVVLLGRLGPGSQVITWGYLVMYQSIAAINRMLLFAGRIEIMGLVGVLVSAFLACIILIIS